MPNIPTDRVSLDGEVVVVTGAGSGIGEATAVLAARRGARVTVCDLREDAAKDVAGRITEETGRDTLPVGADVSSEDDVQRVVDTTVAAFGGLTGFVNNAGTLVAKPLAETTLADWQRTMDVNATGTFLGCRAAVRQFLRSEPQRGAIVNIGSISAVVGLAEQAAYCASKGAVLQLSRQIAVDYAARGIRCNVVGPGSVRTAVLDAYLRGQADPEAAEQTLLAAHPIGRLAAPDELAEAVVWLLSDAASFVTGANLQVDGGYTAV